MPQSLANIPVHFIWSTQDRYPFIKSEIAPEVNRYMAGIFKAYESPALKINMMANHVHILAILSRKITVAKLVEEVKKSTSKWIKTKGSQYQHFYWQNGYGAFGVGQSRVEKVIEYIENQHKHHHRMTFQEEYIAFLNKYQVPFDEKYVWD